MSKSNNQSHRKISRRDVDRRRSELGQYWWTAIVAIGVAGFALQQGTSPKMESQSMRALEAPMSRMIQESLIAAQPSENLITSETETNRKLGAENPLHTESSSQDREPAQHLSKRMESSSPVDP